MESRARIPRPSPRRTPGAPPGSLVALPGAEATHMHLVAYGEEALLEEDAGDPSSLPDIVSRHRVTWIAVDGLADTDRIQALGEAFGIHRLPLEDVFHLRQRPKLESYEDHVYLVTRMFRLDSELRSEQVSIFLGDRFVLTFQAHHGDCFDSVRERIRRSRGRIRTQGSDYLFYALLDTLVDSYVPVAEELHERIDEIEDEILEAPHDDAIVRIHDVQKDVRALRRVVAPLRDAVGLLVRDGEDCITADTRVYLRDCLDHLLRLHDQLEAQRELGADLANLFLSSASHRMNEIMKVLTIFAGIFIPLTFLTGIYGMNFDPDASPWNMPELRQPWGYPLVWATMLSVTAALLWFFHRKGWLGHRGRAAPRPASPHPPRPRRTTP